MPGIRIGNKHRYGKRQAKNLIKMLLRMRQQTVDRQEIVNRLTGPFRVEIINEALDELITEGDVEQTE